MQENYLLRINSILGKLFIISDLEGVNRIFLGEKKYNNFIKNNKLRIKVVRNKELKDQFNLYLKGKLKNIKVKLNIKTGTLFQRKVWNELKNIPYGRVLTYKDIAANIGSPYSYRAVGNAVGANPIPIIIPCHRVVSKYGIGGYAYGINAKRKFLELEGIDY